MSKPKMSSEYQKKLREIQAALDAFPRVVREKKRRYLERQRFLKRTFGDLVKELDLLQKKQADKP